MGLSSEPLCCSWTAGGEEAQQQLVHRWVTLALPSTLGAPHIPPGSGLISGNRSRDLLIGCPGRSVACECPLHKAGPVMEMASADGAWGGASVPPAVSSRGVAATSQLPQQRVLLVQPEAVPVPIAVSS